MAARRRGAARRGEAKPRPGPESAQAQWRGRGRAGGRAWFPAHHGHAGAGALPGVLPVRGHRLQRGRRRPGHSARRGGAGLPGGGRRGAQVGAAGPLHRVQPHRRGRPRALQRGAPGRAAPPRPAALPARGARAGPRPPPAPPGHPGAGREQAAREAEPRRRRDARLPPLLPRPVCRVLRAFRVPGDFHARHAATSRTYLYRLATGCDPSGQLPVFERSRCWALRADTLDLEAMQEAARHLLGTHDFSAFQSAGSPALSTLRTLRRACVGPAPASPFLLPQESRRLRFWNLEFESRSFLYRQVRRMTAVLVAVGLGRLSPMQVKSILESRDPLGKQQSRVAPAHGLFLKSVLYGDIGALSEAPDTWVHTPHEEASKATSPLEVSPMGPSSYHPILGPGRGREDQHGHGCTETRAAFSPVFTGNGTDFT